MMDLLDPAQFTEYWVASCLKDAIMEELPDAGYEFHGMISWIRRGDRELVVSFGSSHTPRDQVHVTCQGAEEYFEQAGCEADYRIAFADPRMFDKVIEIIREFVEACNG